MKQKAVTFEIKSVNESDGLARIEGYAAHFNNIDRGGDVIVPGAFASTLPAFLKDGLIVWQHQTTEPIGSPVECYEDGKGLFIAYDLVLEVPKAREAYALMKANVVKKHSFGYEVLDYDVLDADNMELYAPGASAHDIARALDYWGLALKRIELYEVSPVSIPCNPLADITSVKNVEGLRFDEQFEMALAAVNGFSKRAHDLREKRMGDGRDLSQNKREQLKSLHDAMTAACGHVDILMRESVPQSAKEHNASLLLKARLSQRRASLAAQGINL